MLYKVRKFFVFTTKPKKLDDLVCDGKKWINRNRAVL